MLNVNVSCAFVKILLESENIY